MRFIQGVNRDYPVRRQPNNRVQTLIVEVDAMPFPTEIAVAQLSRIIGLPDAPPLIDVRAEEEFRADPRVIPTARRQITARNPAGLSIISINLSSSIVSAV
jgi:hypothetical protein